MEALKASDKPPSANPAASKAAPAADEAAESPAVTNELKFDDEDDLSDEFSIEEDL